MCVLTHTQTHTQMLQERAGVWSLWLHQVLSCTLWLGFLESKYEDGMENAHLGMPTALLPALTVSLNSEQMG